MKRLLLAALITFIPEVAFCDSSLTLSIFVDTYSAYAKNNLSNEERPYFTQSSQDQDYHLNLASAGLTYDNKVIRGKLVGQYGDSVDINYIAEPEDDFKFIQESYLGAYLDDSTTVDLGTFLAHIGAESWLSKDNLNYTRSFIAEFSPYYETGIRLSHTFDANWSGQLLGLNGWQNTTEAKHLALGTQLAYTKNGLTITSNTFLGEENDGNRLFHNLIVSKNFDSGLSLIGSTDLGYQSKSSPVSGTFWGYSLMGRQALDNTFSINARFESYQDPDGVIVSSITNSDFKAYGASVGLDASLGSGLFLRGEIKHLFSPNKIFLDDQDEVNNDTIFVISLSFFDEEKF
ncbi:porin [bacterium]|nr:porin [bacterium]